MENEKIKKVLNKLKKENLLGVFENENDLQSWLKKLNDRQINNYLALDINLDNLEFPIDMLLDLNLLNCIDYNKRIEAINTLKNGDGCWQLFDNLLEPDFLKSTKFYQDIKMISTADTARYALWVIGEKCFINSPYHDEDLKLIVETHDENKENPLDFVVSDALATTAGNIDSIKSKYHQIDMYTIAKSGSNCLQMSNSYPQRSINNLAINKVSLQDKYHLENMIILSKDPIASEYLYQIMTNESIVKGKNYRKEIAALLNAKSEITARALYYYIANPTRKFNSDINFYYDKELGRINDAIIINRNTIPGNKTKNYLANLELLNTIPDMFIMHYVSILMDQNLINNKFTNYDLQILKNENDKSIFMDLYRYITNETSLENPFHKSDIELLRNTSDSSKRKLLLEKVTDINSLYNQNRSFDLNYIKDLDLNNIDDRTFEKIYFFLFSIDGINADNHRYILMHINEDIAYKKENILSRILKRIKK